MKKFNQKGFSLVEGLLILFIVLVLGGIGYYVWSRQNNNTENASQENSIAESDKQQVAEQVTTENLQTGEQEISEEKQEEEETETREETAPKNTLTWVVNGAIFEISSDSIGALLTYNLRKDTTNLSSSTLFQKEVDVYGKNENCYAQDFPLGRISVRDEKVNFEGYKFVKKLKGNRYLYYVADGKASSCYRERPALRKMIRQQINQLEEALQGATSN